MFCIISLGTLCVAVHSAWRPFANNTPRSLTAIPIFLLRSLVMHSRQTPPQQHTTSQKRCQHLWQHKVAASCSYCFDMFPSHLGSHSPRVHLQGQIKPSRAEYTYANWTDSYIDACNFLMYHGIMIIAFIKSYFSINMRLHFWIRSLFNINGTNGINHLTIWHLGKTIKKDARQVHGHYGDQLR